MRNTGLILENEGLRSKVRRMEREWDDMRDESRLDGYRDGVRDAARRALGNHLPCSNSDCALCQVVEDIVALSDLTTGDLVLGTMETRG